jgi:hypothetical protein
MPQDIVRSRVIYIGVGAVLLLNFLFFVGRLQSYHLKHAGSSILEEFHQTLVIFLLPLLLPLSIGLQVLDNVPLELCVLFIREALIVGNLISEIWTPLLYAFDVRVLDQVVTDLCLTF